MLALFVCSGSLGAKADQCPVVFPHQPDEAEKAYLAADYEHSADLYRKALEGQPNDPRLIAGLSRALERQQKSEEAVKVITDALAAHPDPALLETKAEAEFHDGRPWDAEKTAQEAGKGNLCNPRMHLLLARINNLNSNYAAGRAQLLMAHQLDPTDPEIRTMWISTLSAKEEAAELEKLLSEPAGFDAEERRAMEQNLEHLKKALAEPLKPCRLVSDTRETEIAFSRLMRDATHIRAFGLNVKFNQRSANLEIDTGASGLVVSRSIAEHAGIKPFSEMDVRGIGDKKINSGYRGYADSIQISSGCRRMSSTLRAR
jgi:tetratricopeptide (TPR) repeat protein